MTTKKPQALKEWRVVSAVCRLYRELSGKRFDEPTALLNFLVSKFKELRAGWIGYVNFFRSYTGPLSEESALRLSLSALSAALLKDTENGLPAFVKILSIRAAVSDQLTAQKVHISYVPILTFGVPGVRVDISIPLSHLRRLLVLHKINRYPMRSMADSAGIYVFLVYSADGKLPMHLTASNELLKINTKLLNRRYCINGVGRRIACPECKTVHVGRFGDCPYWKVPDTLDDCIRELELLRK